MRAAFQKTKRLWQTWIRVRFKSLARYLKGIIAGIAMLRVWAA